MPTEAPNVHYRDERAEITKVVVGSMDNNVFVVRCRRSGAGLMVDAANEADVLLDLCGRLNVQTVVQTHGHGDHIQAVPPLRQAGYCIRVHQSDAHMLPGYDDLLQDEDVLEVGELRVRALHTPGHTWGSMCFAVEGSPVLLSGDTLFPGGPGATRFVHSSFDRIMESVDRLMELRDDTRVLPGHGASTTVGTERPHVEEWRARGW
ncbi:MAG TPA: MBL fold metallo-hydrolase [Acidimicrobiales bacterium]|jgi:glyoxylase-like metal-dependent hydrolase (beta-lactamase superfamily II)